MMNKCKRDESTSLDYILFNKNKNVKIYNQWPIIVSFQFSHFFPPKVRQRQRPNVVIAPLRTTLNASIARLTYLPDNQFMTCHCVCCFNNFVFIIYLHENITFELVAADRNICRPEFALISFFQSFCVY